MGGREMWSQLSQATGMGQQRQQKFIRLLGGDKEGHHHQQQQQEGGAGSWPYAIMPADLPGGATPGAAGAVGPVRRVYCLDL